MNGLQYTLVDTPFISIIIQIACKTLHHYTHLHCLYMCVRIMHEYTELTYGILHGASHMKT